MSTLALPGQPCETPPREWWTAPEKWVWQQICEGKVADFHKILDPGRKELDPDREEGWSDARVIRPAFLKTILLNEPFRSALPPQGVRVAGAWIKEPNEPLDISYACIAHQLWLEKSRIDSSIDLSVLRSTESISFDGSVFRSDVKLPFGQIDGLITMVCVKVKGALVMNNLSVGTLRLSKGAEFNDVDLTGAKVSGPLEMIGAKVQGKLDMESVTIGHHLYLGGSFFKSINLIFANVNGNMDISLATVSEIDMSGARIKGELSLGSVSGSKPIWQKGSRLVLRNAEIGALQDAGEAEDVWPDELHLDSLTYTRLGGFSPVVPGSDLAGGKPLPDRQVAWFIEWLEKDKSFTPQPYQQLAGILYAMGNSGKANAVLYACKQRERREAHRQRKWGKWLGLSLLEWTIGYGFGYRYFRALGWITLFAVTGFLVLSTIPCYAAKYWVAERFVFSISMLLPFIKLNEAFKITSDFSGWQLYYFYFHELIGYLLGSFVLAGLAGITKK